MKLNLPVPGNDAQRLLFSNVGNKNQNEFYLLMTFHKSKRGGFDYSATTEECMKALEKKGYIYKEN